MIEILGLFAFGLLLQPYDTEVYLFFYEAVLQTFIHFNKFLQREDPLIPVISEQMDSFLKI